MLIASVEQRRSGARLIKLVGVLDEHNQLGELVEKVGTGTALINLAGVERVNSSGARDWVKWLASIEAKGIRPMLIACSPAVVEQLNRIKEFAGNAVVKSFQVPYHCATCAVEKRLLVYVADMGEPPHDAPTCACDGCGASMRFIDETGGYFTFLRHVRHTLPAPKHEAEPDLARGSSTSVTDEHVKTISHPRLPPRETRPSLSAFQVLERYSEHEMTAPRVMPGNDRPYLIAIIALLIGAVGVLVALLFL